MSNSELPFEVPSALEAYLVSEKEFLLRNPEYRVLATGAAVFHEGKLLLVKRSASEKAFPNMWEVPGGKVDDTDETILHAVVRELKEETGLNATKIVRKVAEFSWEERRGKWLKLIFEVEVEEMKVVLDPIEHEEYLFATEEEVKNDKVGDIVLTYITPPNKAVKLEAFRLRQEQAAAS